jgi:4-azaleucine resistance transporter AzlC
MLLSVRSKPVNSFYEGARDTLPLILAAVPFGILFGALSQASGVHFWTSMAMSLFVFAGSAQFVALNLLLVSAPVLVVVLATFFVNLRHLMYSANLVSHVWHLPRSIRAVLAFWLTDETFAVVSNRVSRPIDDTALTWYYLGSALFMYVNWQVCTLIGFYIGAQLSNPLGWGLDIAMVVAFIGVVAPMLQNVPMWVCAFTAFFSGILTKDWPYQSGLIFSMIFAIAAAMLSARLRRQSRA